jgi:hypothetical protein
LAFQSVTDVGWFVAMSIAVVLRVSASPAVPSGFGAVTAIEVGTPSAGLNAVVVAMPESVGRRDGPAVRVIPGAGLDERAAVL